MGGMTTRLGPKDAVINAALVVPGAGAWVVPHGLAAADMFPPFAPGSIDYPLWRLLWGRPEDDHRPWLGRSGPGSPKRP
jgi:hypothetical protein